MAVYDRSYRRYAGPQAPERARMLVIPRYALREVFASKIFTAFYVLCLAPSLAFALIIYLHHNVTALTAMNIPADSLIAINERFFLALQTVQGFLSFLLAVAVGPALICPDLANNALPLYLSRPLSRSRYIAGKVAVLAGLMSLITWVPGLMLFVLQWSLAGNAWLREHGRIAGGIVLGSGLSITLLTLLSLAVSAWVRRKAFARVATFGIFLVTNAFGGAINQIFGTRWGGLLDMDDMMASVWISLYGMSWPEGLPPPAAWAGLAAACALFLAALFSKVRAYGVVR